LILAIDPGTSKLGWAYVDSLGKTVDQGILLIDNWDGRIQELVATDQIRIVVLGDGTNRVNIEGTLARLLPQAKIVVVDETDSTVDAWKLKRNEEAGTNVLKRLVFLLKQLFVPKPVDDYAARVLAQRYLAGGNAEPGQ